MSLSSPQDEVLYIQMFLMTKAEKMSGGDHGEVDVETKKGQ